MAQTVEDTGNKDDSGVQRRLVAVLAADVVGYSSIMEADESGTLLRLQRLRDDLLLSLLARHQGRLFKQIGDGFLAEFASVTEALRCAIEIQRHLESAEEAAETDDRAALRLRIGVTVGPVVVERGDLYGETVNLAARLEHLAPPGGILVSRAVAEHAGEKTDIAFEDWGERRVKNIAAPVRVFAVSGLGDHARPQTIESATGPDLAAGDGRPSVAVLPFENLSGQFDQDAVAMGIAEEIITALSKFRWVFVIARNSSFVYKGRAVDIKQVARELGVRYVLEGSYNRMGDHIRVHAQLIDAATGHHVWAERYDHQLVDLFAMLDTLSGHVVQALEPEIVHSERERHRTASPETLSAWQLFMRAQASISHLSRDRNVEARALLHAAVERDPSLGQAHGGLALTHVWDLLFGWSGDPDSNMRQALAASAAAIALDPEDSWAHVARGTCRLVLRQHDDALRDLRLAVKLDPNSSFAHTALAFALAFNGDPDAALTEAAYAERLSPNDPIAAIWQAARSYALFALGRYHESFEAARLVVDLNPDYPGGRRLAAANAAMLDRPDVARAELDRLMALLPGHTVSATVAGLPIRDAETRDRYAAALRTAGLPD